MGIPGNYDSYNVFVFVLTLCIIFFSLGAYISIISILILIVTDIISISFNNSCTINTLPKIRPF